MALCGLVFNKLAMTIEVSPATTVLIPLRIRFSLDIFPRNKPNPNRVTREAPRAI